MDAPRKSDAPKRDQKPATAPARAPGEKKGRANKALQARAALARDVADEVKALRGVFSDILEIYRSRVDGQLAGLAEAFREAEREGTPPPERALSAMLETVRSLKVKPRKGRIKDLARLEALAECLWEILPPGR